MNELRAYADGRWADFGGLDACTLAEADAAARPPPVRAAARRHFGGEPTQFAVYSGAAAPAASRSGCSGMSWWAWKVGSRLHRRAPWMILVSRRS